MNEKTFPSLADLETLLAVIDHEGVTVAAEFLGEKQPVVSRRIAEFRDRFGLLAREGKSLRPTDRAWQVLPAIRQLVRQHALVRKLLLNAPAAEAVLRLGVGNFGAAFYVPELWARLRSEAPDWRLETRVVRGEERIVGAAKGLFDMAVVTHDEHQIRAIVRSALGGSDRIACEPLAKHELGVVAHRKSQAGQELAAVPEQRAVPLAKLAEWDLIGLSADSGIRQQLDRHFVKSERRLRYVAEGAGWAAAKACASRGIGVAVLPLATLAAGDERDLVVRRLPESAAVRDYLIYRPDDQGEACVLLHRCLAHVAKTLCREVKDTWG